MIGLADEWNVRLPLPDGTINKADRRQYLSLYAILLDTGATTEVLQITLSNTGRTMLGMDTGQRKAVLSTTGKTLIEI